MARVVVVHGINKQYLGPRSMHLSVARAVLDGACLADSSTLREEDVEVAFYGDWFRPLGRKGDPQYTAGDVVDPFEVEMLYALWEEAARAEPDRVPSRAANNRKVSTPVSVQRALDALSHSRFLAGVADHFLIGALRQVRLYLTDSQTRATAQRRVSACIRNDTTVLIGHSLGSVVAYEALCAHPAWPVRTLVTLGSPLGIRNLVFDRLTPQPIDGHGMWPPSVSNWINICDRYDVVALVKLLAPLFGERIEDATVRNGWRAHDLIHHLTAIETGRAVAVGLSA